MNQLEEYAKGYFGEVFFKKKLKTETRNGFFSMNLAWIKGGRQNLNMFKTGRTIAFMMMITFSSLNLSAGGPWTQKKGKGFFKLSEWWVVFDQHFNAQGEIKKNRTTGVYNTSLFGEYGLNDKWTGIVNANVFARNYTNNLVSGSTGQILSEGEELNAIGDIDLGIKYGLTKPGAKFPIAASVYFGIPSGKTDAGSTGILQTGDGEFNQMILIDFGKGISLSPKISAYVTAFGGFNHRTNGFSNELRYGSELGIGFFNQRLWLVGRIYGVESMKNQGLGEPFNPFSIYENNSEYGSMAIEVNGYVTKRWGLSFGNATAFHGEIIAGRSSFTGGVFYDLSR